MCNVLLYAVEQSESVSDYYNFYAYYLQYMTYLSTFLSGWYIMAVTVERAMVVRNPFDACRLQKCRAQKVVLWITVAGVFGNLWVLMMVEVRSYLLYYLSLFQAWH